MRRNTMRRSAALLTALLMSCCAFASAGATDADGLSAFAAYAAGALGEAGMPDVQNAQAGDTEERSLSYDVTWQEICTTYPLGRRLYLDIAVLNAQNVSWQEFVDEMYDMGWICHPFDARGTSLPTESLDAVTPSTHEHLFCRARGTLRDVLLDDIIVRGDVLGTGMLGPSQLVRLARAVTDTEPLEGLYAVAGDLNDNGDIELADLAILASWVKGRYIAPPNVSYSISIR